jgi:hypothetical protein
MGYVEVLFKVPVCVYSIPMYMTLLTILMVCRFFFGSVCGSLKYFCFHWSGSIMLGCRPSRLFVVGVSVKLSVLIPRVQSVLCAGLWGSLPAVL